MFICVSLFFLNRGDSMALIKINKKTFTFLFVITLVLAAAIPFSSALTKPSVTLPADWELTEETPYPEEMSEHDPEGSGMVQYQNNINFDGVMIYYEDSLSLTYTNNQLKSEVENIFERDHEGYDFDESGIMTIAGVSAGYAKAYDQEYDAYILELVFVKGSYYINAYAFYDANTASENSVMALLNSIGGTTSPTQSGGTALPQPTETPGGIFSGTNLLIIIGIIVAVVVVVVVVVLLVKKKKPAQIQQQNYIPPPPPT